MSTSPELALEATWTALTHRAAALAGALTGLLALLAGAPAQVASLRGALAWCAALLVGRAARWLAQRVSVQAAQSAGSLPQGELADAENDSTLKPSEATGR